MKKIGFILMLLVLCSACEGTYVTKKTLESQNFSFLHAGKTETILVELKEIKTTTRNRGIISVKSGPYKKNVSFAYAIYVSINYGISTAEIFELPCNKDADLDDFIAELKVKRSKKRDHVALGYKDKVVAVFDTFKKVSFLVDYPMAYSGIEKKDFNKLDLSQLDRARENLKKHLNGEKKLLISDEKIERILLQLPPNDELNYELSYTIGERSDLFQYKSTEEAIIKHCKKDQSWLKSALKSIKNKKSSISIGDYLMKLNAVGGAEEVIKEDEFQYKLFKSNGSIAYFQERVKITEVLMHSDIKKKFKTDLMNFLKNPCSIPQSQQQNMYAYIELAEDFKIIHVFDTFFEAYEKSSCLKKTLHEYNNQFMFTSPKLGASDTRKWIAFVVEHFDQIEKSDRRWDYNIIEEQLTCEQKKILLSTYKKDIDTFNDMVVPECN